MKLFKSRKGFTLIELLVVIGILAVLAAIAIPSVAGLIDRANKSADQTNANEMTNAIERFASEYELYCQDIASGAVQAGNLDSAQGRVYNVLGGATTRAEITALEKPATAGPDTTGRAIYRDTKYPVNAETMQAVVENYTKTSSSTFEPKQSDMHYWYSPDCGVVVVAEPDKTAAELDGYVISGMDAKGNDISGADRDAKWIDLTNASLLNIDSNEESLNVCDVIPEGAIYTTGDWYTFYSDFYGCTFVSNTQTTATHTIPAGNPFPEPKTGDIFEYNGYKYEFNVSSAPVESTREENNKNAWILQSISPSVAEPPLDKIGNKTVEIVTLSSSNYSWPWAIPKEFCIPKTTTVIGGNFFHYSFTADYPSVSFEADELVIPKSVTEINWYFMKCLNKSVKVVYEGTVAEFNRINITGPAGYSVSVHCSDGIYNS